MCGDEVAAALVLYVSDVSTPLTTSQVFSIIPCFQVTTHSHLLSQDELSNTLSLDPSHIHVFSLQEFDTELDFSNKVRYVLSKNHCWAVYYMSLGSTQHNEDSTIVQQHIYHSSIKVFICKSQGGSFRSEIAIVVAYRLFRLRFSETCIPSRKVREGLYT